MRFNYVLMDEHGNTGQSLPIVQGEIKTLTAFINLQNGVPYPVSDALTALSVSLLGVIPATGTLPINVEKSLGNGASANTSGFAVTLESIDTQALAIGTAIPITATFAYPGGEDIFDFPKALIVTAPVVT